MARASLLQGFLPALTVLVSGLSAGAMYTEAALLVPMWQAMQAPEFLQWYAGNAAALTSFFAPLQICTLVLSGACWALLAYLGADATRWYALTFATSVAAIVMFFVYFDEVNLSFEQATIAVEAVPAELGRWAAWQWARTAIGISGFGCAVAGLRSSARAIA